MADHGKLIGNLPQEESNQAEATNQRSAMLCLVSLDRGLDDEVFLMSKKYTGGCACGKIKFEFDTDPGFIADCHCNDCKRAAGGEFATFMGVPADDFTVTSGSPKPFHYTAESGAGLDRNFCPDCGSRLFTSNLDTFPGTVFVMLGSLDHPEMIAPKLEMFTKRRLAWMPALDLPQFESMPH